MHKRCVSFLNCKTRKMVNLSGIEAIELLTEKKTTTSKHTRTSTVYRIMQRTVKPTVSYFSTFSLHSLLYNLQVNSH